MKKLCECTYWARNVEQMNLEHHPLCSNNRPKTRKEWIQELVAEGYEVSFRYIGDNVIIKLIRDGDEPSEIISASLDEAGLLMVLADMVHGNIIPLDIEVENDYEN